MLCTIAISQSHISPKREAASTWGATPLLASGKYSSNGIRKKSENPRHTSFTSKKKERKRHFEVLYFIDKNQIRINLLGIGAIRGSIESKEWDRRVRSTKKPSGWQYTLTVGGTPTVDVHRVVVVGEALDCAVWERGGRTHVREARERGASPSRP